MEYILLNTFCTNICTHAVQTLKSLLFLLLYSKRTPRLFHSFSFQNILKHSVLLGVNKGWETRVLSCCILLTDLLYDTIDYLYFQSCFL